MASFARYKQRIPPAILSIGKYSSVAGLFIAGAWQPWSRQCYFEPFGPENDPLFQTRFLRMYNPNNNPSVNDSCVRKVPLDKIRPELVEDALAGGSMLLERFCAGVWGGYGYALQRRIMTWSCRDESNKHMLWDKKQLLDSAYKEVLKKSSKSIIMRGGMSPSINPDKPREMDNLSEITVNIDLKQGQVEFRLKNIFFNGSENGSGALFPKPVLWLHFQYCKLLVEAGVSHCVR
ncbi:conserved hypothetical protein [Talaromyces stipitatus ATCC 10500]|uniref:Uncharacterized protein n=1 Tax=Talaromyces stipitatus (strain ATCC 10500 / CBS 375.48 / QM 6759 / NRRL 1006) TaxID=441959 RepID=B8MHE2_TALSN|nr:uncharacterized protein TSTA_021780 [Talaromyces stipitatus ATCC 10500]EED17121.1 conserved hypothetical protein [Talaromyces stipitatus ATCC 10500]